MVLLLQNQDIKDFVYIGNNFYFLISIPLLLIFAWHGSRAIARKNKSILFKVVFILFYISGLIGLLILGNYLFLVYFFGLAP